MHIPWLALAVGALVYLLTGSPIWGVVAFIVLCPVQK